MWPHPTSLVLDCLFAAGNLMFTGCVVTVFSLGDDLMEYCQVKLHLSTSVEMELQRTNTAISRDLRRPSLLKDTQLAPQHSLVLQQPLQTAPSLELDSTSSTSSSSHLSEPEYHTISEQVMENRLTEGQGVDSHRVGSLDSNRMQCMERQDGERPWFSIPEPSSIPYHSSELHSNRSSFPDDDVSSQILEELYQKGRGRIPSPLPTAEDPLWYEQNQSNMSVERLPVASTMTAQAMSAAASNLYAEVQDSNHHVVSSTPVSRVPHIEQHPHAPGDRSASLTQFPGGLPSYL